MRGDGVLEVRGLGRAFSGVQALREVQFEVRAGEVHALMGENGAGKSTLVSILAGLQQPDSGEILLGGRSVMFRCPHDALRAGISLIHQELLPFLEMSVAENIMMGREPVKGVWAWMDWRRLHEEAGRCLRQLGADMPTEMRMGALGVAQMQIVEIAKAVSRAASVVLMDEPTSALSEREVAALFRMVRDLRARGVAVVYISHRLAEVRALADRVTVLRDGRRVGTFEVKEVTDDVIIRCMVGRSLDAPLARRSERVSGGEPVLSVEGLTRRGCFSDVHFEVGRGEVVGLAGLMGAGRSALGCALGGLLGVDRGTVRVAGRTVRLGKPRDVMAAGIVRVTDDRRYDGLVGSMSVAENVTLSCLERVSRGPWLCGSEERRLVEGQARQLGIRAAGFGQPVAELSGGNQQKVLLARAMLSHPRVLVLDEPTRGIDVGAKGEVARLVRGWADAGISILLISSELPELLALSDRVLVMRGGCVVAELAAATASQEEILRWAMPDGDAEA